jgi:hypothetical protein
MYREVRCLLTLQDQRRLRKFIVSIDNLALIKFRPAEPKVEVLEDVPEEGVPSEIGLAVIGNLDAVVFRLSVGSYRILDYESPVIVWYLGGGDWSKDMVHYEALRYDSSRKYAPLLEPYFELIRKWIRSNSKCEDKSIWVFEGASRYSTGTEHRKNE